MAYQNERNKSKQKTQHALEKKDRIDKAAAEHFQRWKTTGLRTRRINEPVWPPPSPIPGVKSSPDYSNNLYQHHHSKNSNKSLLYDNVIDAGYEIKVRTLLLRGSIAVELGCLDKAQFLIAEALETARKLDYIPIEAKCKYWEAMVLHKRGRHGEAERAFVQSRPCVGRYIEGEEVDRWLEYYQRSAFNSPTDMEMDSNFSTEGCSDYKRGRVFAEELLYSPESDHKEV